MFERQVEYRVTSKVEVERNCMVSTLDINLPMHRWRVHSGLKVLGERPSRKEYIRCAAIMFHVEVGMNQINMLRLRGGSSDLLQFRAVRAASDLWQSLKLICYN